MAAYILFKKKRGRPIKINPIIAVKPATSKYWIAQLVDKGQLSEKELKNVFFYQSLYRQYLQSINAPHLSQNIWHSLNLRFNDNNYRFLSDNDDEKDKVIKNQWQCLQYFMKTNLKRDYKLFNNILESQAEDYDLNYIKYLKPEELDLLKKGLNIISDFKKQIFKNT